MTDAKLRPEDLTREERAIAEQEHWRMEHIVPLSKMIAAIEVKMDRLEAAMDYRDRCALFAPAQPEPEPDHGTGEFVDDGFGGCWEKCDRPDCGLQVVRPGKAQCAHDCHEPIRETQPKPAVPEMPEAIASASKLLRSFSLPTCTIAAGVLEFWWHTHAAQLPSVRSRERLIGQSEALAYGQRVVDEVIAAQPVRLEKVRIALSTMRAHFEPNCQGQCEFPMVWNICRAALRELDAHEGKGEGEMSAIYRDKGEQWMEEERAEKVRRLARYDEAIRLLRLREPGCSGDREFISSVDLNRLTAAFLAAEPKEGR